MAGDGRLYWQCRRGMRELDLMLLGFLERGHAELDEPGRRAFERLLETADPLLLEWLMGRESPADRELVHVVEAIRRTAAS